MNGSMVRVVGGLAEDWSSILHPHDGSKLSITPVPEEQMPFSDFLGHRCACHAHTYKQMKHSYTKN